MELIGLGKMGGNLALQGVEKGICVVGKARHPKPELVAKGVRVVENYGELTASLKYLPESSICHSQPGRRSTRCWKNLCPISKEEMSL